MKKKTCIKKMYWICCSLIFLRRVGKFLHFSHKIQVFSKTTVTFFLNIVLAAILCAACFANLFILLYLLRPSKVSVGAFLAYLF